MTHAEEREALAAQYQAMAPIDEAHARQIRKVVAKNRKIAAALRKAAAEGRKVTKVAGTFYAV